MTTDDSLNIEKIEQDILDLKTSIRRVNNSTAGFYQSGGLASGRYQVTYEAGNFPIMSYFEAYGAVVCPNTPSGNTQIFYLNATTIIRITSNRKIVSVSPI